MGIKRIAFDISTKSVGLAVFNYDNELEWFMYYNLDKLLVKPRHAIFALPEKVWGMADIIADTWPKEVEEIIVEITPIPGWVGRVIILYTGAIIGSYLSLVKVPPKIKFAKPREWQKVIIPEALKHKENRKKVKELSIEAAFKNNIHAEEVARKHFKKIDDIADAINLGKSWDYIQGDRISQEIQDWSGSSKNIWN